MISCRSPHLSRHTDFATDPFLGKFPQTTLAALIGSQIERMDEITTARNSMASLEYSEQLRQALYEISEQTHIVSNEEDLFASLHQIDIHLAEQQQETLQDTGSKKGDAILVMDDEEMVREIAAILLNHLGYEVRTCASGEEAVELYRNSMDSGMPFRAVVMDLTIPGGLGGKEAAEQILASFPKASLIVSSGYSNDPVMANFREFGFCGAIAKPYNIGEFERVLNALQEN